jgi:HPt (histidine-containing phosphotransfer) domain-containing protein
MTDACNAAVDRFAIITFLADFDAETVKLLIDAADADISEWSERLLDACAVQDLDGQQRARHSLKGVCSNFGAAALLAMANEDLSTAPAIARFRSQRQTTIAALRTIAETM